MPRKSTFLRSTGFTLIELLVVVAIISILAAILFPVFARARENARRSSCMSNLKQIGLGVMMYAQDYDERYPPGYLAGFWYNLVDPYIKSAQIFRCPSADITLNLNQGNYGANRYALPVNSSLSLAVFEAPASTYMIFDSGGYILLPQEVIRPTAAYFYLPGTKKLTPTNTVAIDAKFVEDYTSGRHFGGVNMCFADGHVKWLSAQTVIQEARNYNAKPNAWAPANPD